jgi:hypothetical protein
MTNETTTTVTTTTGRREGSGCFFKGCMVLLVLMLLFLGAVSWGAYTMYKHLYALTSGSAVTLPVYDATPEQYEEVRGRIEQFSKDVDAGKPASLHLTDADLNTMVAKDPNYAAAKGDLYFVIKDRQLHIQGSFPLDGVPTMKGRYLNANIALTASIEDGLLTLQPTLIQAGDKQAPAEVLKGLQAYHWGDALNSNPQFKKTMGRVRTLHMEQDAILLETK